MSIDLDDLSRMLEKTGVKAKIKTDGVTAKVVIPDNRPEGRPAKEDHFFRHHLKLLYPDNVLFVLFNLALADNSGRFRTLSAAMKELHKRAVSGECRKFSVVITEGEYTDELVLPWQNQPPPGLEVEFCGIGAAKITFSQQFLAVIGKQKITLRNLTINDYRSLGHSDKDNCLFDVLAEGSVHLTNVKIESEYAYAREMKDAIKRQLDSPQRDRAPLFSVALKSRVVLTKCEINDGFISLHHESSLSATETKFNKAQFKATDASDLCFDACEFLASACFQKDETERIPLMQVQCGVSVEMKNSSSENWPTIVSVKQRGTKVLVENCKFDFPERSIAFLIAHNADATIVGNRFACRHLLHMQSNLEGKVEFRQNEMTKDRPHFILDHESNALEQDFKSAKVERKELASTERPHAKEKSKRNEMLKSMAAAGADYVGLKRRAFPDREFEKKCERCDIAEVVWARTRKTIASLGFGHLLEGDVKEISEAETKFKHCSSCKTVCYCSRVCQKADWKDHKALCAKYAASHKSKSSTKKSTR